MRLQLVTILVLTTLMAGNSYAYYCSGNKSRASHKTTVATPEENDYDVKGLKFNLELTNTSTYVSGDVTTYATTNIANFGLYAFELHSAMTIDSLKINGQLNTNITSTGAIRKVALGSPMATNTDFTVQVFYHGTAPGGKGQFFTGGLNHVTLSSGTQLMYSLSDDLFADDWWPCKQSIQDKIDSVTMWLTVDDTLKAGSNGLLKNTTTLPGNKHRYEWQTSYPIDYYLICVAVAPYKEYSYYMHFTDGSNDSMLVQNYYYDSASFFTPGNKFLLDSTGIMIDHFSKVFGKYPFHQEKYGHCMTVLSGGMEHQTMTFMSTPNIRTTLIAHELAHQWWGNSVTYGKWEDIWLSEGMATYTEQLFLEQFWGNAAAKATRTAVFNQVMSQPGGSVWVNDTTNVNRIFDGRLTYNKGAAVAHMLRYLAPKDSLYFTGLRVYQQQYKYGTAVTSDLQQVMEQTYAMQLDSFFRQWVYGQGYPTFTVKWAQYLGMTLLKVTQTTSHPSVRAFELPLQIKLNTANGDTTVTINITDTANYLRFNMADMITSVVVDPDDNIVNRTGLHYNDPGLLAIEGLVQQSPVIYPNPASEGWHVDNLQPGVNLQLVDLSGRKIWSGVSGGRTLIPAANLPTGCYLLEIQHPGGNKSHYKLLK
ncbi:MAG TPA: M1 family aminopeptidase [Flavipsychrobacter sp.]